MFIPRILAVLKSYRIQRNSTGILGAKIRFYCDVRYMRGNMTIDEQRERLNGNIVYLLVFIYNYMLGVSLWAGLSAHTAPALATWPVSASIPNANLPV